MLRYTMHDNTKARTRIEATTRNRNTAIRASRTRTAEAEAERARVNQLRSLECRRERARQLLHRRGESFGLEVTEDRQSHDGGLDTRGKTATTKLV